jgi:hypothetical protein
MKARPGISVLFILMILGFSQTQCRAAASNFFLTGNDLVAFMREWDRLDTDPKGTDIFEAGRYCGFVDGVFDVTMHLYGIPKTVTKGQIVAVVSKYLKDHPEKWGEFASVLVIEALKEAFPLKSQKGGGK